MPISYPPQQTSAGVRPQYTIPATIGTTFPVVISGTTSPTTAATMFIPPTYLYQTSGSYFITVIADFTSSTGATATLDFSALNTSASFSTFAPFGPALPRTYKFAGNSGVTQLDFSQVPLTDGVGIPITLSGSTTDYTASIYGIYYSPTV